MNNTKEMQKNNLKNEVTKKWLIFEEIAFSDNKNADDETNAFNEYMEARERYEAF
jgi:hypothetical protein